MGQTRKLLRAAVAAFAAAIVLTLPAAAAAQESGVPQPRYEAPERPLPPDPATAAAITGFEGSWVDRALTLQYELSADVALRNAPWVGTHNSYNSVAEMGNTIATADPNQQISIVDQLDLDVRSIELDVHWFQRPGTSEFAPVVCHAFATHQGCSTEKPLNEVLDEVNAWLRAPANDDQVLFIYLEDHLDNQTGYDTATAIIQQKLGDILYAPTPGGGCQKLPFGLTRKQMRKAGKRVILVGNSTCGVGSAWPATVFNWEDHEEAQPRLFSDFPTCGTDFTRAEYDSLQVRYFEDGRPAQGGRVDRITPEFAAGMTRCGVDLLGLDQLIALDARLESLVWSWASGQPKRGGKCAVQAAKRSKLRVRWKTLDCDKHRRPACRKRDRWLLGTDKVVEDDARAECKERDAKFAVPRTGYEAQQLRKKMLAGGERQVWLGYVKRRGDWVALDKRSP